MQQTYQIKRESLVPDQDLPLFCSQKFHSLRFEDSTYSQIILKSEQETNYLLAGKRQNGSLLLGSSVPFTDLKENISSANETATKESVNEIFSIELLLRNIPNSADAKLLQYITADDIEFVDVQLGFYLKCDQPYFIDVIKNDRKKRKLKQLQNQSLFIQTVSDVDQWHAVYSTQIQWRHQKGHKHMMSTNQMIAHKNAFPDHYFALLLKDEHDNIQASAFYIKFENQYYVYSLIQNPSSSNTDLSLLLWEYLYNEAVQQKILFIDMGGAMLNQKINRGLASYKNAIGGKSYKKYRISVKLC